jgi:hypothetical protein
MAEDGTCPTCGRTLASSEAAVTTEVDPGKVSLRELAGEERTPWHFKLLMILVIAYLVWRTIQMASWLF